MCLNIVNQYESSDINMYTRCSTRSVPHALTCWFV